MKKVNEDDSFQLSKRRQNL